MAGWGGGWWWTSVRRQWQWAGVRRWRGGGWRGGGRLGCGARGETVRESPVVLVAFGIAVGVGGNFKPAPERWLGAVVVEVNFAGVWCAHRTGGCQSRTWTTAPRRNGRPQLTHTLSSQSKWSAPLKRSLLTLALSMAPVDRTNVIKIVTAVIGQIFDHALGLVVRLLGLSPAQV